MERIKEALEKSRKDRENAESIPNPANGKIAGDSLLKNVNIPQQPARKAGASNAELLNPDYIKSRVVELNPIHLERNRIFAHNKKSVHSNIFDLLRTQILAKMAENGWRSIAITSPCPEVGKSMVAINLAMSIAHHPEKTSFLVDFDLRRPAIARYLGLKQELSLNDYLEGKCELNEVLVNPGIPRMLVMAPQRPMLNTAELLVTSKVKNLITEIRNRYQDRILIFDLPPLLNADDAMTVLPYIDCVLLVVANGLVREQDLKDSMRYLSKSNIVGSVFNKGQSGSESYSYY